MKIYQSSSHSDTPEIIAGNAMTTPSRMAALVAKPTGVACGEVAAAPKSELVSFYR